MKLTNLLSSIVLSLWIGIIAVFSVQNYTGVSLKFSLFGLVRFEAIELPLGVMLAFCFAVGAIAAAILPLLWQGQKQRKKQRKPKPNKQKYYYQKRESSQKIPDPLEDW